MDFCRIAGYILVHGFWFMIRIDHATVEVGVAPLTRSCRKHLGNKVDFLISKTYPKTYMDSAEIEEYKKRLEKERLKLIDELLKEESPTDFGSDAGLHEEEEVDEAESLGNQLALGRVTRERVNEIDAALNRIREGKYGVCEKCGQEIGDDVLNISPESRYCKNCKTQ